MKTKKVLFAVLASVSLLAASCTSASTAEEDSIYQTQSIDRDISKKNIRA
ncbi:hypothetical protein [uncultured Kriegella sp.]